MHAPTTVIRILAIVALRVVALFGVGLLIGSLGYTAAIA
jgi:hypothetical protein